jgi:cold shock CspA family protein
LARSNQTFSKRERELKREKKRKEKEAKKLVRAENKTTLDSDDMIAYVDEFGQITSTPPDLSQREEVNLEDIAISVPKKEETEDEGPREGIVSFFNTDKGFGFIRDLTTQERVFVHVSNLLEEIAEDQRVTFEIEMTERGAGAVKVARVK